MVDLHFIASDLAVGARFEPEDCEALVRDHGLGAVVDVREESRDDPEVLARHGLRLLHLPTLDMTGLSLAMLDQGVGWVGERRAQGERVLIHCEHGVGRSALLAVCVLVASGQAPLDALRQAKSRRKVVSFSEPQQRRFAEWCSAFRQKTSAGWTVPGLDEIQHIVWVEA